MYISNKLATKIFLSVASWLPNEKVNFEPCLYKLGWIPFYEQHKIDRCIIMYKRINGYLPSYLNEHLILNNKRHSRNTRFSSINAVCPKYRRETEGGCSFANNTVE